MATPGGPSSSSNPPVSTASTRRGTLTRTLTDALRQRIVSGDYPAGSRLPSEADIGAEYGVSRVTVRAALQALEARGLLNIRHGAGSFVAPLGSEIRTGLDELRSMTETIRELGYEPAMRRTAIEIRPATVHESRQLGLLPLSDVWSIEREVSANGEIVAYSHDVVSIDLVEPGRDADGEATAAGATFGESSTFAELESRHGLRIVRALAEVHAVAEVPLPSVTPPPPATTFLLLDQLHEGENGERILYSRTYFVEGHFQFVILRTR